MSVLQVNNITDTGGSTLLGRRNAIINGNFDVWQRGTARTFVSATYSADRWACGQFQQAGHELLDVSADTSVPFSNAMRVTSSSTAEAAAGTRMVLGQMVESVNCSHLAGQEVTLSAWVKFSAASYPETSSGAYLQLYFYDAVNPNFNSTTPTSNGTLTLPNGSLPTTWTKITLTVTVPTSTKTIAPRFGFFDAFSTTNNGDYFYDTTGWQLEAGSVATPFERRSVGEELALCQRYYFKEDVGYRATSSRTDRMDVTIQYPVTMRAKPTTTYTSSVTFLAAIAFESPQKMVLYYAGAISGSDRTVDTFEADAEL